VSPSARADVVARAVALAEADAPDVSGEWDPRWHLGPIEDRPAGEREAAQEWMRLRGPDLDWLYGRLEDDSSRETLVRLLAHRLAGSRRVALGPGRAASERITSFAATALACEAPAGAPAGLPCYDLEPIGLGLRVIGVPMFVIHTFLLEQYRHPEIEAANVRAGDTVVDGGAYWGDTALWLAEQCAPDGRVVAFEPDPDAVPVLEANLRLNPRVAERIEVRREALWDSETNLDLAPQGAATTVGTGQGAGRVPAVTLDGLRRQGVLGEVDFVKLDVEGAEANALRGAADLLRRRAPRLAVAVYHRPDDLVAIPRLLAELQPDYRFALTHRSLHQFDTVLFAWR
jgi:FkbM family methyltransferase